MVCSDSLVSCGRAVRCFFSTLPQAQKLVLNEGEGTWCSRDRVRPVNNTRYDNQSPHPVTVHTQGNAHAWKHGHRARTCALAGAPPAPPAAPRGRAARTPMSTTRAGRPPSQAARRPYFQEKSVRVRQKLSPKGEQFPHPAHLQVCLLFGILQV